MTRYLISLVLAIVATSSHSVFAGESMTQMPLIKPKKTTVVSSVKEGQALVEQRGFGEQEGPISMMNLMMVEGSGYEGMAMDMTGSASKSSTPEKDPRVLTYKDFAVRQVPNPNPLKVGGNEFEISIENTKTKKPATGLVLKARVYMTTMNMGETTPTVEENSPGHYRARAVVSMAGSWAVELTFPDGGKLVIALNVP